MDGDGLLLRLRPGLRARGRLHPAHRDRRPAANAESVLAVARECHDDGVAAGGVPRADAVGLLDRGHPAAGRPARRGRGRAARHRRGLGRPAAGAGGRRAAALPAPRLQHRRGDPPRTGAGRGAEVVPADLSRVLRAPPDGGRRRRARRHPDGSRSRRGGAVRSRPAVRRRRSAGLRAARRDLRGHVGADTAERGGRAGGCDGAGQPVRQPDHHRSGRGPQPAGPLGVVALPGRLRLRRGRGGRVHHRPGLGRPDDDLRERRAARRVRALPQGAQRRSVADVDTRAAALRAAADGHVRRQPASTTTSRRSRSGASSFELDPPSR